MNLKIKHQLILAFISIATVSILVSSFLIGRNAITTSKAAIQAQVEQKLISARNLKKVQIESYFNLIQNQLIVASSSPWIMDAADNFSQAMMDYEFYAGDEINKSAIKKYYTEEFGKKYSELNNGVSANIDNILNSLSDKAWHFQQYYIAQNPHPLGSKDEMVKSPVESSYNILHQEYHPTFRKFLKTYGYYDLFIVEPNSGQVVYSVFKELDFATSLKNGPYKDTGLAEAFNKGMELTNADDVVLIDFKPYYPSFNAAASFMASPIIKDGERIGILILQMPIDGINEIMTNNHQWKEAGFGESGETYLVGSDLLLRSQSRFLIEDKPAYLAALSTTLDATTIAKIDASESAIGLQKVNTSGAKQTIANKTGVEYFNDYRDVPVISAFSPVIILDLRWGILSEIDQEEAYIHQQVLIDTIIETTLIIALILISIMAVVGTYFTKIVIRPIDSFSETVVKITQDKDLTQRISIKGNNEFSVLALSLNEMLSSLADLIIGMRQSAQTLTNKSNELNETSTGTSEKIHAQNQEVNAAATATTELSASISEVAKNTEMAASNMTETKEQVLLSTKVANGTQEDIYSLQTNMDNTIQAMSVLEEESQSIAMVLDVIQNIAEQTNLLALNAAIEAARAGEQGRGFAVVADEVRTLASRTGKSTDEIRAKISSLQNGVEKALETVQQSQDRTKSSIEKIESTVSTLKEVSNKVDSVNSMNIQIAAAAEEQSQVTEEINRNVILVKQLSDDIFEYADKIMLTSKNINDVSDDIYSKIDQFKA